MDSSRKKTEHKIRQSPEPEKKRESRLTSIIDQLISNKAKGLNNNNNNSIKEANQKNNKPATEQDPSSEENHKVDLLLGAENSTTTSQGGENHQNSTADIQQPTIKKEETPTFKPTPVAEAPPAPRCLNLANNSCGTDSTVVNGNSQVQTEGEQLQKQSSSAKATTAASASPGTPRISSFASANRSRKKCHHHHHHHHHRHHHQQQQQGNSEEGGRKTSKDGEAQLSCTKTGNHKTLRERSPPSAVPPPPPAAAPPPPPTLHLPAAAAAVTVQPLPVHPPLAVALAAPATHQHPQPPHRQSPVRLPTYDCSPPADPVVTNVVATCTAIAAAAAARARKDFGYGIPVAAALAMPADTLVVDPAKIKTERLSPPALDSLSSPSGSPSPTAACRSPASSTTSSSRLAGIVAAATAAHPRYPSAAFPSTPPPPSPAPTPSTPGLDRFSPASLGTCTGTPILKQMEQMMTRNYSDFMRSLAAKYNNSNPTESYNYAQVNGFMRNFDGRFPFKTATPPLTGLTNKDDGNRKNENHSAPPVLGDQRGGTSTPLRVVDLSSTQALINMMRSASAHSASQLENYLRGTLKRPLGLDPETRVDPLDLTVNSTKKSRTDGYAFDPSALNLRLHGGKSIRDLHDLFGSFKSDSEGSDASSDASPKSTNSRLWSAASLVDSKPPSQSPTAPSPGLNKSPEGGPQHPCLSTCADRACSEESDASVVAKWTVDDVCKFVASIDICAEYVETFREQSIDGAALPLLTEEHLINNMNMKLGPALKFRATLAKAIGHCAVCMHCIHCHGTGSPNSGNGGASERRTELN